MEFYALPVEVYTGEKCFGKQFLMLSKLKDRCTPYDLVIASLDINPKEKFYHIHKEASYKDSQSSTFCYSEKLETT